MILDDSKLVIYKATIILKNIQQKYKATIIKTSCSRFGSRFEIYIEYLMAPTFFCIPGDMDFEVFLRVKTILIINTNFFKHVLFLLTSSLRKLLKDYPI